MGNASLDNVFTYHAPHGTQPDRYVALRATGKVLAQLITDLAPQSWEQSVALDKVQEAIMWANAAIAVNEAQ